MSTLAATKKVLLTGGTGFVGRHVLQELERRGGWDVTVISRTPMRNPVISTNIKYVNLDVLDNQAVDAFFDRHSFEHLIHFAWYIGPKCHVAAVNVDWLESSLRLLRKFQQTGGIHFMGAGTVSEYDFSSGYLQESSTPLNNPSLHGKCKSALFRIGEDFAMQHNVHFQWPRMFNPYGAYERSSRLIPAVIRSILRNEEVRVSPCTNSQDYLHVNDTARAVVDVFENPISGAVNVSSGNSVCLRTIVERIAEIMDYKQEIRWGAVPASNDAPFIAGSNIRLTNEVGWVQKHTLEAGLQQTINWWKEHEQH